MPWRRGDPGFRGRSIRATLADGGESLCGPGAVRNSLRTGNFAGNFQSSGPFCALFADIDANLCSHSTMLHAIPCNARNRDSFSRNREFILPNRECAGSRNVIPSRIGSAPRRRSRASGCGKRVIDGVSKIRIIIKVARRNCVAGLARLLEACLQSLRRSAFIGRRAAGNREGRRPLQSSGASVSDRNRIGTIL